MRNIHLIGAAAFTKCAGLGMPARAGIATGARMFGEGMVDLAANSAARRAATGVADAAASTAARATAAGAPGAVTNATSTAARAAAPVAARRAGYGEIRHAQKALKAMDTNISALAPKPRRWYRWWGGKGNPAAAASLPALQAQRNAIATSLEGMMAGSPVKGFLARGAQTLGNLRHGIIPTLGAAMAGGAGYGTGMWTGLETGATQAAQAIADKVNDLSAWDTLKLGLGKLWDPNIVKNKIVPDLVATSPEEWRGKFNAGTGGLLQSLVSKHVLDQINQNWHPATTEQPQPSGYAALPQLLKDLVRVGTFGAADPYNAMEAGMRRAMGGSEGAKRLLEDSQRQTDFMRLISEQLKAQQLAAVR